MTESRVNERLVKLLKELCGIPGINPLKPFAGKPKDSLAAAAPDLLEALENLTGAIEFMMWVNNIEDDDDDKSYSEAIYQAKMAIGKAKGWV